MSVSANTAAATIPTHAATAPTTAIQQQRKGFIAATTAFILWGLNPIYFKLVKAASAEEVIAHRMLWSVPVILACLWLREKRSIAAVGRVLRVPARTLLQLLGTGSLLTVNWVTFVWAVNDGQVLATSLGYFINPLFHILFGAAFLHERLSRGKGAAVLIATAGTAYFTWHVGSLPMVALILAVSFGLYAYLRKTIAVGPLVGLLWETMAVSPLAVGYLIWLGNSSASATTATATATAATSGATAAATAAAATTAPALAFGLHNPQLSMLLALAGVVTVMPLLCFNVGAKLLPLNTVGFLQYIAPSLTFTLAVVFYGEAFTQGYAVAFGCIWAALALVTAEGLMARRNHRTATTPDT